MFEIHGVNEYRAMERLPGVHIRSFHSGRSLCEGIVIWSDRGPASRHIKSLIFGSRAFKLPPSMSSLVPVSNPPTLPIAPSTIHCSFARSAEAQPPGLSSVKGRQEEETFFVQTSSAMERMGAPNPSHKDVAGGSSALVARVTI